MIPRPCQLLLTGPFLLFGLAVDRARIDGSFLRTFFNFAVALTRRWVPTAQ